MYKKLDNIFTIIIRLLASLTVVILFLVISFIFKESMMIYREVPAFQLISGRSWRPLSSSPSYSILPMILATLYVSFIAIGLALPIGVGSGLYLACFLKPRYKNLAKALINILAGIPSVVYGFIGLVVLLKYFEKVFFMASGESVLAAGILLSIMILPYIISTCEESMTLIKDKYMAASDALGLPRIYMIRELILPASVKSIIASTILALGRAMGETMAVMMVIGNAPIMPKLLGRAQTIPSLIALEMSTVHVGSLHYHGLFAAGFTLMILLFIVNGILYYIRRTIRY